MMTEQDILGLVNAEYEAAEEWSDERSSDVELALDYYHGLPLGNEEEGHSQVVSSDVSDVVEWTMPDLVRVVVGGDELVEFESNKGDDRAAKLATKLAHHVFFVENNGFLNAYDSIKDGLLCKVGALKRRWCERKEPVDRDYNGLSELELAMLLANLEAEAGKGAEVSVIGQEIVEGPDGSPRFNVRVRVMRVTAGTVIEPIPPEELRVSRQTKAIDNNCRYLAHDVDGKTRSDLVAEGVPMETVLSLPRKDQDFGSTKAARSRGFYASDAPAQNVMMEPVEYVEHYVLADIDGDGIAERRLIVTSGNVIVRNEVLASLPIAAWSPFRMPHTAIGLSLADKVMDIQRIQTALIRGTMDNMYAVNAGGRYEVVAGEVSMDDLLTMRPGGVVRVKQAGAIRPLPVEWVGDKTLSVMSAVREWRAERTGVNQHKQGLSADMLAQTDGTNQRILSYMDSLTELMARLYVEGVIKPTFEGILDDIVRYQDDAKQIRVAGEVLEIDPSAFREKFSLRVKVGTGNAKKEEKFSQLMAIKGMVDEVILAGAPIAGMEQAYNVRADLIELANRQPGRYFIDPKTLPPPQPKQPEEDPLVKAELVKSQARMAEAEQKAEFDRADRLMDRQEWATEQTLETGVRVPGSMV